MLVAYASLNHLGLSREEKAASGLPVAILTCINFNCEILVGYST